MYRGRFTAKLRRQFKFWIQNHTNTSAIFHAQISQQSQYTELHGQN